MGGGAYRPRFLRAIKTIAPTPTAVSTTRLGSGVADVTPAKSGALAAMKIMTKRNTEFLLFNCSSARRALDDFRRYEVAYSGRVARSSHNSELRIG